MPTRLYLASRVNKNIYIKVYKKNMLFRASGMMVQQQKKMVESQHRTSLLAPRLFVHPFYTFSQAHSNALYPSNYSFTFSLF